MKTKTLRRDKIDIITLGCSKNLVDSEVLRTQLKHNQLNVNHSEGNSDANIIVINTCGFIDLAKEESINTILEYAEKREKGEIDKLYVMGCLSQRYKDDLEKEIPAVDAYFGTRDMKKILARFKVDYKHELVGERLISTPQQFAYLKIAEGCNRTCAFCAIPLMRGKHTSRTIESLIQEAKNLAKQGVKEIILISQELTYYGLDVYKRRALADLVYALNEVDGIEWIRLHYCYPSKFPLELLDAIKDCDKVCKYLDVPFQHGSNSVLERMHRQVTREEQEVLIQHIREKLPQAALRTTMIVGFPGETEEEFEELCDFVRKSNFDRLGVFTYSHEEDTTAYQLEDNIPTEVKQQRAQKLMEIQQEISYAKNSLKVGHTYKVLIDREENGYYIGRTEFDSPEVDNEVLISIEDCYLRVGDFAPIKIVDATEFDLYGVLDKSVN
ncbi:MAG: 30S ribosomal protein S12 methylthiotransferase RimO [Chitinophagales bacterium]|nr:30S ribosomal protein S12 methylthiotransferase RimO [Chitinophagales bacterium]